MSVWEGARLVLAGVLGAFTVLGGVLLVQLIAWPWDLLTAAILLLGVLPLRVWKPGAWRVVGCVLVPVLALLGANFVWAKTRGAPPDPLPGLAIATAFIAGAACVFLYSPWVASPPPWPVLWVLPVVLLVPVPPVVVGLFRDEDDEIPTAKVVSRLHVVAISGGSSTPAFDRSSVQGGWRTNSWVGQADGESVRWTGDEPAPRDLAESDPADTVLLLMVDGPATSEDEQGLSDVEPGPQAPQKIDRWLALADSVTEPDVPTFALLRSDDQARRDSWTDRLTPAPRSPDGRRHGGVLSLHGRAATRTIAEHALGLAVSAPTADGDLTLAMRHRPALFFDSSEAYARPLNIDSLLKSGKLRLCPNDQPVLALCDEVDASDDLVNGDNHLGFETTELAGATRHSTIYVHVTRPERADPTGAVYLDYWWYFPHNPTYAAGGALCSAGFVIAEITCHDHQSDWEGVTVVVDPSSRSLSPVAVHYAAHKGNARYTWPALTELWSRPATTSFTRNVDTSTRPLVFVAKGTHAAYPTACVQHTCDEYLELKEENRHGGEQAWHGNPDRACHLRCVEALPTRQAGDRAALWNAYEGRWGNQRCDLLFYCSSTDPPKSPSTQARYKKPWCANRLVALESGHHVDVRRKNTCADRK